MGHHRLTLCTAFILFLFSCTAHAGLAHDSQLTWVTAESTHFRIHYHDGEKKLADKALHIAESVYKRLTPIFDWYPQEKTEIVLSDETDASNGFATPLPSNRITLFVTPPSSVNSLEDHAGWLETLILHEFVHTLHLDKASGFPENTRNIFGRMLLLFPNVFMPPWMHEGLATYYETDETLGIGRGQNSYFQMMMRLEVENGIKPLRQINQPMVSWPLLTSRYLYGVYFYQFIADTYGADKLPELVQMYSRNWVPFRINGLYHYVLGKDLSQLWADFEVYLRKEFEPQLHAIEAQHVVQGLPLTQTGDFKRSVLQMDDGRVLFVSDHLATGSQLMLIKQGEEAKVLSELNWGASLDWHEVSGLLIAQPDFCDNANQFYDLYQLDVDSGKKVRLTQCQRYIAASWSPDGKYIVAVRNDRGQHALHLLDAKGVLQEVLWQGSEGETLSGIDWSADEEVLVSSVWRQNSGWDLVEFNMNSKTWSKLTDDMLIKSQARYVQGSHDVVFSMDIDDVYNIYRLQRSSGKTVKLTHVLGGAFSPFITQDDGLLSVGYTNQGFDVYKLEQPLSEQVVLPAKDNTFPYAQFEYEEINITEPKPYSPWDSVLPTSWLPSFAWTDQGIELGTFVYGSDVLNRHNYSLFAGYNSASSSPVYALDYVYDRWFPLLKIHAEALQTPSFDSGGSLIALTENTRLDAEVIFPTLHQKEKWSMHFGLNHQTSDLSWLHPAYVSTGLGYKDTLMGAALVYHAGLSYPRAISNVSTGRLWSGLVESGSGLKGDYEGSVVSVSGREYFDLSHEQVLAVRLDMGKGSQDSRPFRLGGTINGNILPNIINPLSASASFNQRAYALRGYGEGEPSLMGRNMALVSAEYRFPITRIERGWMAPPLGIHQVFGQFFVDTGRAWDDFKTSQTYIGVGAELGADLVWFYNLPMRLQLGYAEGLDEVIGGNQVYFRLGSSF